MEPANFNLSYIGQRHDILELLPEGLEKVLDVGCSTGVLGEQIKQRTLAEVMGIEVDQQMSKVARDKLDKVITGDVEGMNLKDLFPEDYFDCIIFADVLEHLKNPGTVLKNVTSFLKREGLIVACIPNIRHYSTLVNLIFKGIWPYRERGIHDKSHLRFFSLKNIQDLFCDAGLKITKIKRKYRLIEHRNHRFDRFLAIPCVKDFFTFQYLITARKAEC